MKCQTMSPEGLTISRGMISKVKALGTTKIGENRTLTETMEARLRVSALGIARRKHGSAEVSQVLATSALL